MAENSVAENSLQINQIIDLEAKSGEYQGVYPSRVEGIENNTLLLAAPIKGGFILPIAVGTAVEVSYVKDDAAYSFTAHIIDRKAAPVPLLVVPKPQEILKTQRRNFFRFNARLPMTFTLLNEELEKFSDGQETHTRDISGGGLQFATTVPLSKGDQLSLVIRLPGIGEVKPLARVVRVWETPSEENIFLCSVEFNIIEESDRDKIIRFIFEQQRKMRAKGLL